MKALRIIAVVLACIIILIGVGAVAYYVGTQNKSSSQENNTNQANNDNNQTTGTTPSANACTVNELTLSTAQNGDSGAGTLSFNLVFTNSGNRTCELGGYPGVSLINNDGTEIGSPANRVQNAVTKAITLQPGNQVSAAVFYSEPGNYDPGVCQTGATQLRVYPPSSTAALTVATPGEMQWCPGFEVGTVQ